MTETRTVTLQVNGREHRHETEVRTSLADFLRHELGYTGTHVACEQGVCGSCTVLLDGMAVRSCLLFAVQAEGAEVTTVESLGRPDDLSAFQESMRQEHGLQCGFCTPGLLMGVLGEARAGRELDDVLEGVLAGHLCRCTGYVNIRAAIRRAWPELKA